MLGILDAVAGELLLFAACGFLLFAIDDFLVDMIWLGTRFRKSPLDLRTTAKRAGRLAVFVPAWQEASVISEMVNRCVSVWPDQVATLFIGTYPNDPDTRYALAPHISESVRVVVLDHDGPTTKADCLNGLWSAMKAFEEKADTQFAGIVLHDAEDQVHPNELTLFQSYLDEFDLIQIPVIPDIDRRSRWVSGHYLDEFAEAHQKELLVRQWVGASLPSAGTGCAVSRAALGALAEQRNGRPFDAESLTEDYELGLRLAELGFKSRFVREVSSETRDVIAVHSHFPPTLRTSVRQKTRWVIGIALAGWDRTGWRGGLAEHWMRWRDRRSILAALLILAAYLGLAASIPALARGVMPAASPPLPHILAANAVFLAWRLTMRVGFTSAQYGLGEGLRAAPRSLVSNLVSVMASVRAVVGYCRMLRSGVTLWDKTEHQPPDKSSLP